MATKRSSRPTCGCRLQGHPVVPKGDEEIRFQITADHTAADIDEALGILRRLPQ
jgi:7-keto-8-aminopelargonate synthetase-like enzyme